MNAKLWLRKRALMALRSIVWRVDDWLHGQEIALREAIEGVTSRKRSGNSVSETTDREDMPHQRNRLPLPLPVRESFQQWEARRSGVAVISKKSARRHRPTAAEFDARYAR